MRGEGSAVPSHTVETSGRNVSARLVSHVTPARVHRVCVCKAHARGMHGACTEHARSM